MAASITAGMLCSNSVPMSLTRAASTNGLSPLTSLAVTAIDMLRSVARCVAKRPMVAAWTETAVVLRTAAAFMADQRVVGQQHVVEEHFGKMCITRQVTDRAHRHAWQCQIDNELRQAFLPVLRLARRAHQRDHVVAVLRVGGPYLAAVQPPAA